MDNRKKILMATGAIVIFAIVGLLVYFLKKEKQEDIPALPVLQAQPQTEDGSTEKSILESLSAPAQSGEDEKKTAEEEKAILDSLSAPKDADANDEKADAEVLKSLEAPSK